MKANGQGMSPQKPISPIKQFITKIERTITIILNNESELFWFFEFFGKTESQKREDEGKNRALFHFT